MSSSEDLKASYKQLMARSKDLVVLGSAGAIIHWDMETKMPPRAIQLRSQQLALLEQIGHKMLTDAENGRLLDAIERHPDYDSFDQVSRRNVHLTRKAYDEATKLPEELVTETAKQQAIAIDVWKKAKAAKDYSMFKPELAKLFDLRMQAAEILQRVKETKTPYDALIDIFEPKMTGEAISRVFKEMREGLIKVLDSIEAAPNQPDTSILEAEMPVEVQRKIAEALSEFIGYDVKSSEAGGRIDETEHPFSTGYYDDVRITTHYHEDQFISSVFSVLHEGGHALYEQGLPREWMYQPAGAGCSMGIHESMSRFVENFVGRSREFWSYFLPRLVDMSGALKGVNLDQLHPAINRVRRSKIRIEADEVTYGLHIIIRFEMERDLFAGKLEIDELPQVWNQKYRDYIGVEVEHDSEGVMQDTHWAGGSFGYFPSYALGNIYGGMIRVKMEESLPDWRHKIGEGSFDEVRAWLTENVYRYGNLYDPEDLIQVVTGGPMNIEPFINYLDGKFSAIYGY